MPVELVYLILLVAIIVFLISVPKRPVYEATLVAFVIILFVSWKWSELGRCLANSFSQTILYTIFAFMAFSVIMKETKVMDSCVAIITSLFGRFKGGTAYADVLANTFLGALSGGGPQNVLLVGSITLPAMKKAGVPDTLAVNVSSFDSVMGNFIPPSPAYAAAFGIYAGYCGDNGLAALSSAELWGAMWLIALLMIVFRMATIFISCKAYKVSAVPRAELPRFREAMQNGWKAVFLPVVIALPFILDMTCAGFVAGRIGPEAAGLVSKSVLLFLPGTAAFFALFFGSRRPKAAALARAFSAGANGPVMICAMVLFSMMIGNILSVGEIGAFLGGLGLPPVALALIIPLLTTLLAMIVSSVAVTVFFGGMILSVTAAGADPLLVTAMLPLLCGGLSGTIPPSSPCLFIGADILKCNIGGVNKIAVRWVIEQLILIEALFVIACLL